MKNYQITTKTKEFGTNALEPNFIRKYIWFDVVNKQINIDNWLWVLPNEYKEYALYSFYEINDLFCEQVFTSALIEEFCIILSNKVIDLIREHRI